MTTFAQVRRDRVPAATKSSSRTKLLSERYDSLWLALGTAAVTVVTFLFGFWGSGGHLAAPLDDTFIHFQYARQLAGGNSFEYNTGDPPSSGESSFIYPFLLAPAYWLGLGGMRTLLYADALSFAAHLLAVLLLYRIGKRLGGRAIGLSVAVLFLLDGRLNWVYLSGMETGIYTAALIAFFWAWLCLEGTRRYASLAAIGAFTALVRPEGHILVSAVCVVTLAAATQRRPQVVESATPSLLKSILLLLPVLAGAIPYVVNVLMTGHWQFNTAAAKSIWYVPYSPLHENVSVTVGWAINAMKNTYLGLEVGRSPFPLLGAALVVLGAGMALSRRRLRIFHSLMLFTLVAGIGLALLLPSIQFNRYYQPYDFIFYLYIAMGLLWLARRLSAPRRVRTVGRKSVPHSSPVIYYPARRPIYAWLFGAVIVLMLPQFVSFFFASGESSRDIYYQQMTFSDWIRRYTPPDARIGVNDTGAHKYLGDRYIIDLIGLTHNEMRGAYFGGWGSVFDRLSEMPEARRPTHLLIHPNVFLNGIDESISQSLLTPVYAVRIQNPIITAGDTEVLYQVNWEYALLDAAETQLIRRGAQPIDTVNVGDVVDEERHGYRLQGRLPSISEPKSIVSTAAYEEGGFSLTDSGRRHSGWEEFTVRSEAGKRLTLVARARLAPGAYQNVLVWANGTQVDRWEVTNEREGAWQEYEYTIPANLITSDRTTIRLDATHDPGGPGFASYRYWVYSTDEGR